MSGPDVASTGRAVKANQRPFAEYAADWPTRTTLLAISIVPPGFAVTATDGVALTLADGLAVGGVLRGDADGGATLDGDADGALGEATATVALGVALGVGLGVGFVVGSSLPIGTTETEPLLAADGSLTTIRRSLSDDPNTLDALWSSATGCSTVEVPSSHGVADVPGQTASTFLV